MATRGASRREFLINSVSGLGAAWVATHYSSIIEAADFAQSSAGQPPKLAFFSDSQAADVNAMAAQIIPTDDTPGAREARVINFIDRALVTFEKDQQPVYTQGLKDLNAQVKTFFPSAASFSALTPDQQ